jgi:hypothetical protein
MLDTENLIQATAGFGDDFQATDNSLEGAAVFRKGGKLHPFQERLRQYTIFPDVQKGLTGTIRKQRPPPAPLEAGHRL